MTYMRHTSVLHKHSKVLMPHRKKPVLCQFIINLSQYKNPSDLKKHVGTLLNVVHQDEKCSTTISYHSHSYQQL